MKNKKRIILEMLLIALSFVYLSYLLINNVKIIKPYIFNGIILTSIIIYIIKYIKELDFQKTKYDKYKIFLIIFLSTFLIFTILNIFNIFSLIFNILLIIFIILNITNFIYLLKKITKEKSINSDEFWLNYSSFITTLILLMIIFML